MCKLTCNMEGTHGRSCAPLIKVIPADVGHGEAKGGRESLDSARDQGQALHASILLAALKQQLESKADPKEWPACLAPRGC